VTVRERSASLGLNQIAAVLWALCVLGVGPGSPLVEELMVAACAKGGDASMGLAVADDECSVEGLTIYRRLREVEQYLGMMGAQGGLYVR
jgi:hypothetical protein